MDHETRTDSPTPAVDPAVEADDATRREAAERLATLLALAPAAALLFDSQRAEAYGEGSFE